MKGDWMTHASRQGGGRGLQSHGSLRQPEYLIPNHHPPPAVFFKNQAVLNMLDVQLPW